MRLAWNTLLAVATLAAAAVGAVAAEPTLAADADFPGGSVHVIAIDQAGRLLSIQPADHPGRGWRCWWYLKVTGIRPGETLRLRVVGDGFALPERAVFSLDGRTWNQTPPGKRQKGAIEYAVRVDAREAWFAWGPPYLPSHAANLIAGAESACPRAKGFELCRTREGRPVPALRLAPPESAGVDAPGVWVQARQHAWESGSSWVCHGFVEWLVSSDPAAKTLRRRARVTVVPIMDVDGVVLGAGGKGQDPHDHNRDWNSRPHWPGVAAAQKGVLEMDAGGRLAVFVDLHNPGPGDHEVFFYTPPRDRLGDARRAKSDAFFLAARGQMTGPLAFKGLTKESGAAYSPQWQTMSKNWVNAHTGEGTVAVTLETPWNTPHSTQEGYRQVGRQLGLAIARYLERPPVGRAR